MTGGGGVVVERAKVVGVVRAPALPPRPAATSTSSSSSRRCGRSCECGRPPPAGDDTFPSQLGEVRARAHRVVPPQEQVQRRAGPLVGAAAEGFFALGAVASRPFFSGRSFDGDYGTIGAGGEVVARGGGGGVVPVPGIVMKIVRQQYVRDGGEQLPSVGQARGDDEGRNGTLVPQQKVAQRPRTQSLNGHGGIQILPRADPPPAVLIFPVPVQYCTVLSVQALLLLLLLFAPLFLSPLLLQFPPDAHGHSVERVRRRPGPYPAQFGRQSHGPRGAEYEGRQGRPGHHRRRAAAIAVIGAANVGCGSFDEARRCEMTQGVSQQYLPRVGVRIRGGIRPVIAAAAFLPRAIVVGGGGDDATPLPRSFRCSGRIRPRRRSDGGVGRRTTFGAADPHERRGEAVEAHDFRGVLLPQSRSDQLQSRKASASVLVVEPLVSFPFRPRSRSCQ
mmetsp:Transcript_18676/g.53851  ORF Transcript_18676/g.53851 Transcript_18676/m.53851 type:complete len:447 (+) Transcript_18676:1017-2357(+)